MSVLKVENIWKSFPGVLALRDVTFEVGKGEVRGLVGENGAGKSTLIKILTGVYKHDRGKLFVYGREIRDQTPALVQRLGIYCVHQETEFVPYFTVSQALFLGREPLNKIGLIDVKKMNRLAQKHLEEALGVSWDPTRLIETLSRSESQLLSIARVLLQGAKILIFDEPTASLEEAGAERLLKTIVALREQGITIIYVSHRLEEVFRVADSVTVLRDGSVVGTYPIGDVDYNTLVAAMVGEEVIDRYPKKQVDKGEVILEVRNIYGNGISSPISFELRSGEILGVYGKVGAGKTELAELIAGLSPLQGGIIRLRGRPVRIRSVADAVAAGIVLVPEDKRQQGLVMDFPISWNISLPNLRLMRSYLGLVNRAMEQQISVELVKKFDVRAPSIRTLVKNLSGGNQQKVSLAKWMPANAKVVIFDQPTVGIDVKAKTEIYRLMEDLAERGLGIILITNEVEEALNISDRLLIMANKKIVAEVDPSKTTASEVLANALG